MVPQAIQRFQMKRVQRDAKFLISGGWDGDHANAFADFSRYLHRLSGSNHDVSASALVKPLRATAGQLAFATPQIQNT